MGKCILDGEEFDPEFGGQICPLCRRRLWAVELKTHLIPTSLVEKVQAGVHFLQECLTCRASLSTN